jgi:hypothetical protein
MHVSPLAAALATALLAVPAFSQSHPSLWGVLPQVDAGVTDRDSRERVSRPQIQTSTFVRIDAAALTSFDQQVATRPTFSLRLGGRDRTLVLDSTERMWKHVVYRGHVDGTGHFLLAIDASGIAGGAVEVGDERYSIEYTGFGSAHVVYGLDHDQMPAHMGCGVDHTHEVHESGSPAQASLTSTTVPAIDVAAYYTPAARAGGGGNAGMESTLVARISLATDSSTRSGVNQRFRLVYTAETNYNETGTTTDLSRFRSTTNRHMTEVHGDRNTYGADLMCLIIEQSSQFCGVAYLMTNESTGFASSAFGVTVRGCLDSDTLTHEMGHNMGCSHDRNNANNAVKPYAFGFRTSDDRFRTIMSYAPGSRVSVWSSPNVFQGAYAMGTATEDNARSLNEVTPTIESFRPMTTYDWTPQGGGVPAIVPGLGGIKPLLMGSGTANGAAPVEVRVTNVFAGRSGALLIGAGGQNLPLFGGVLVPFVFDAIPVTITQQNPFSYNANLLRTLAPGAEVYFQAWFVDPLGPQGFAASDAISVLTF